mmetsp:Transcript_65018/g.141708  ORF Transcript_65018/g.141708 Transcript_65018/m.141708 type:complete len:233 (-) Transcript_65018:685-1383(-)
MDDAVTGTQRHATSVHDEVGEGVVCLHVDGLGVRRGVAEGLHHKIGREAKAGQVLELVTGHRAGGVLGTHSGDKRLAVLARHHAVDTARLADHLLSQRPSLGFVAGEGRRAEGVGGWETERVTSAGGESTADDEGDATASLNFVEKDVCLEGEGGEDLVCSVLLGDALIGEDVNHIPRVQLGHVHLQWQRPGVFHGVVEDGGDLAADAHTTGTLVRDERDVFTHKPLDRVGG